MIIIKIMGGLGNQIFQYALALKFQALGVPVKLDLSSFTESDFRKYGLSEFGCEFETAQDDEIEKICNRNRSFISRVMRKLHLAKLKHIIEHIHYYRPELLSMKDGYLVGYWQSEKYFGDIREEILSRFEHVKFEGKNKELQDELSSVSNSVAVHVRRGDYLNTENIGRFGDICTDDYYKKAFSYFRNKYSDCKFYIFTNDGDWVRNNMSDCDTKIIDWNTEDNGSNDMMLMSLCKHNIIANSSFSWWGAWLNKNAEKEVIAPKKWFNDEATPDIWCENWIKM